MDGQTSQTARQVLQWRADGFRQLLKGKQRHMMFDDWLLKHGEDFGPVVKRPKGARLGQKKMCYKNCTNALLYGIVDKDEWFYTEGVVLCDDLPLTIEHAWLSNRKGEVIDLTLRNTNRNYTYFGVPFKYDYLVEQTMKHGYYGLLSNGITYNQEVMKTVNKGRAWRKRAKRT